MDGPFRNSPRPTTARVAARPEPAHRQPQEPQPAAEQPKPVHRAVSQHVAKEKPFFKRFLWPIIAVVIIVVAGAGWFAWSNMSGGGTAIDSSKYQAVFFTNGQVYFGKLHVSGNSMKLTDIFYLQSKQSDAKQSGNPQATSSDKGNDVQLIKLGDEIHGPEDEMIISKDQVLFYENLKSDGKVSQSIQKFKNSSK